MNNLLKLSFSVLALALAASPAFAELNATIKCSPGSDDFEHAIQDSGPATLSCADSVTGVSRSPNGGTATYSASAAALADYGVLKAYAASSAEPYSFSDAGSNGFARFTDTLTIFSAEHDGQTGHMTASMALDFISSRTAESGLTFIDFAFGEAYGVPTLNSRFSQNIFFDGTVAQLVSENGIDVPTTSILSIPVVLNYSQDFIFGRPFELFGELQVGTDASPYSIVPGQVSEEIGGAAIMDAAHSAYWGGISGVSFDGASVPYTLTSMSGTDWSRSLIPIITVPTEPGPTAPVPEPETYAMLLAGLGLLGAVARQRKTKALA